MSAAQSSSGNTVDVVYADVLPPNGGAAFLETVAAVSVLCVQRTFMSSETACYVTEECRGSLVRRGNKDLTLYIRSLAVTLAVYSVCVFSVLLAW